jgi:hypothetical protein
MGCGNGLRAASYEYTTRLSLELPLALFVAVVAQWANYTSPLPLSGRPPGNLTRPQDEAPNGGQTYRLS